MSGKQNGASSIVIAEPTAEVDRGRHSRFPRFNGFAGGPGNLAVSFGGGSGARCVSGMVDTAGA